MNNSSSFAGLFLLSCFFALFAVFPVHANEGAGTNPAEKPGEEKDWLEFYYENPAPDQFVARIKDWADDGTLENEYAKPALIAFISQVVRQNRELLKQWYGDLAGLSPGQMQVFHTGMLFSRTTEADELMRERFGERYDEQKKETRKILEMPLDQRASMDMLWGYFYATGSAEAIRRLVVAFRFSDAPDNPPGIAIPEGYVPLYKELPDFAHNALVENGKRHSRLVEILRDLHGNDETLLKVERDGIYDVLSKLDPKAFPAKNRKDQSA